MQGQGKATYAERISYVATGYC